MSATNQAGKAKPRIGEEGFGEVWPGEVIGTGSAFAAGFDGHLANSGHECRLGEAGEARIQPVPVHAFGELVAAFHKVQDISFGGKVPIVFFDEFDSEFEDKKLGWLTRSRNTIVKRSGLFLTCQLQLVSRYIGSRRGRPERRQSGQMLAKGRWRNDGTHDASP